MLGQMRGVFQRNTKMIYVDCCSFLRTRNLILKIQPAVGKQRFVLHPNDLASKNWFFSHNKNCMILQRKNLSSIFKQSSTSTCCLFISSSLEEENESKSSSSTVTYFSILYIMHMDC